jgi:hypothetical protein
MFLLKIIDQISTQQEHNKNTTRTKQEYLRFLKILNQFKIHSKSFNGLE